MTPPAETVVIVGASGLLGRALCSVEDSGLRFIPTVRAPDGPLTPEDSVRLDITAAKRVEEVIDEIRPRWVINTAAKTSVDGCERDPADARSVNVRGTQNLVEACDRTGSGLILISTNYVFDGSSGPYAEEDAPNPLNVYGQTKLEGERAVLDAGCPGIVVRTAVLYGYDPNNRPNFVTWVAGSVADRKRIRVVTDEWANPTYVDELAAFVIGLCQDDFKGVVHFCGRDFLSRYEMASEICSCFHLDFELVSPTTSAELAQAARRPLRAGLKIDRASEVFDGRIASFKENLERVAKQVGNPSELSGQVQ